MKTDEEIEQEEQQRAQRELAAMRARGGGFSPLVGMTRSKELARSKSNASDVALCMLCLLLGFGLLGLMFGAAVTIWALSGFVVIGLLIVIAVGVWRK